MFIHPESIHLDTTHRFLADVRQTLHTFPEQQG